MKEQTPAEQMLAEAASRRQHALAWLETSRRELEEAQRRADDANENLSYWQRIVRLENEAKN